MPPWPERRTSNPAPIALDQRRRGVAPDLRAALRRLAREGGKIAQVGQRLIDGAARRKADDFFERFGESLVAQVPAAPAGAVPARAWALAAIAAAIVLYLALR